MTDTPENPADSSPADSSTDDTDNRDSDHEPDPDDTPPEQPTDISLPAAAMLTTIRTAIAPGASTEARAAGATACRSVLAVLNAKPGQALVATATPVASPVSPISPLLAMFKQPGFLAQLAAMSREQLLDLVRQATGALPAKPATPTTAGPRFHLIQIPQASGRK